MAGVIDLRTPQQRMGLTKMQQNVGAIMGILETMGKYEQERRTRQKLETMADLMAKGVPAAQIPQQLMETEPEYAGGIPGILQRIGGMYKPPGGQEMTSSILGRILQSQIQSPLQEAQTEYYRGRGKTPAFPAGYTEAQLDALGFTEREWARMNRRRAAGLTVKGKTAWRKIPASRAEYMQTTPPEVRLKHKVSYAKLEPDAAIDAYRKPMLKLGFTEEDLDDLRRIFKSGDETRIQEAIKRIGLY